jgi:DNA repair exonuclease SbcCD ATPase subunit
MGRGRGYEGYPESRWIKFLDTQKDSTAWRFWRQAHVKGCSMKQDFEGDAESRKKAKKKHRKEGEADAERTASSESMRGLEGTRVVDLLRDALNENSRLQDELESLREEAQSAREEAERCLGDKTAAEARLAETKAQKSLLEESLREARTALEKAKSETAEAQSVHAQSEAQKAQEYEALRQQLAEEQKRQAALKDELAGAEERCRHLTAALAQAQTRKTEPELTQEEIAGRLQHLESLQRQIQETLLKTATGEGELARMKAELVQARHEKARAEAHAQELAKELAAAEKQLADRHIAISKSGSLAEASLRLAGVFSAAERAIDLYGYNAAPKGHKGAKPSQVVPFSSKGEAASQAKKQDAPKAEKAEETKKPAAKPEAAPVPEKKEEAPAPAAEAPKQAAPAPEAPKPAPSAPEAPAPKPEPAPAKAEEAAEPAKEEKASGLSTIFKGMPLRRSRTVAPRHISDSGK